VGTDDCLTKPFNWGVLAERSSELLDAAYGTAVARYAGGGFAARERSIRRRRVALR
jgi:DNA-binding response OmpR family regulator